MTSLLNAGLSAFAKKGDSDEEVVSIPLIHLVVLGRGNSGKTSLINSWVNNICPTNNTPTEAMTLYYRTMRIQNPSESEEQQLVTALVEIEDTYPWERTGNDCYGQPCMNKKFFAPGEAKAYPKGGLLEGCDPPVPGPSKNIIHCRMGFIVVFDSHCSHSLETAKDICSGLKGKLPEDRHVYVVANKIDKDSYSSAFISNLAEAREWTKTNQVRLVEVSALEFTRVRKLFRDIVETVAIESDLCLPDKKLKHAGKSSSHKHQQGGEQQEDCGVQ
eukprot:CAMPEP_0197906842 /NCGR_PEP_ID=MMETSP1439-20131203/63565_1 /TAXON_ID=66791 /ORGANISM="Gonyaulax spinifera, Strain CCMP409" /LENGTH=273 /DNA_ID=CAMNT_0043528235 /DNA_START=59 /DNA_END=880 /DNA_ORIENTATION=-